MSSNKTKEPDEETVKKTGTIRKYERFKYSKTNLSEALESVRNNNMSINKASQVYGIPKGTLFNNVHGKSSDERKMGPPTNLTAEEELRIEKWILDKAYLGFPMNSEDVKDAVQKILQEEGRETTFTNSRPGRTWLDLYLKRHPKITKKNAEVISKARASVTEESIRGWFGQLKEHLEEQDALDILEDPSRMINLDETGVEICPKTGVVLGPKGHKNLYKLANGSEKESITVLCTYAADGTAYSPMVVYPQQRLPKRIANSFPESFAIGFSDSGWMTSGTYFEYIANVLFKELKERGVKFPVLIIFDGHKSHINMELFNFCAANDIILFCLVPNATHILQPCDVGIFRPLKQEWKKIVHSWSQNTTKSLTKYSFAPLFKAAYDKATKTETIKKSFETCGIYPFNPDRVDYTKCIPTRHEIIKNQNKSLVDNEFSVLTVDQLLLDAIESRIPPSLLENFEICCTSGQLPEEEKILFDVWKSLRDDIDKNSVAEIEKIHKLDEFKDTDLEDTLIMYSESGNEQSISLTSSQLVHQEDQLSDIELDHTVILSTEKSSKIITGKIINNYRIFYKLVVFDDLFIIFLVP